MRERREITERAHHSTQEAEIGISRWWKEGEQVNWLASEQERRSCGDRFIDVLDDDDDSMRPIMWPYIRAMRNEGIEWPPRWDRDRVSLR